jgi:hypothetical protein
MQLWALWILVRGSGTETGSIPNVENNLRIGRVVFSAVLAGETSVHESWNVFNNPARFLAELAGSRKIVNGDGGCRLKLGP